MVDHENKIMVTVIGGYLGAGKTTLVNHVLRTADERVAVLVNDFGDVNIDADLIESQDGDTISLANGCICCSLVDGLAAALDTIGRLDRRPERLVIEASGVADPASIAAYGHGPGYALDAVVVVVDAETVRARAGDKYVGDTVRGQLRSGDILLLNKVDLVDPDRIGSLREWLATVAPNAVLVETVQSQVGHEVLFGRVPVDRSEPGDDSDGADHEHDHHHDHDHDHQHDRNGRNGRPQHHAETLFDSWTWRRPGVVARSDIESTMEQLPESVVRAKGFVALADRTDKLMVLQRVGRRWSLQPGPPLTEEPESHLVFIGLADAIDDAWLTERLGS